MKHVRVATVVVGVALLAATASTAAGKGEKAGKAVAPAVAAGKKIAAAQVAVIGDLEQRPAEGVNDTGAYFLFGGYPRGGWADVAGVSEMQYVDKPKMGQVSVTPSADGKSAWVSYGVTAMGYFDGDDRGSPLAFRVTELIAQDGEEWRVIAACVSSGRPDKEAHARALSIALEGRQYEPVQVLDGAKDEIEAPLAGLVADLRAGKLGDHVVDRKDFLLVGSAPKELVKSAATFRKAWNAWGALDLSNWVKAGVSPSGTTGYVAAAFGVKKSKKQKDGKTVDYSIAFQIFLVVDQVDGAWQVVQAHLLVP
jgi:hypothetical protein